MNQRPENFFLRTVKSFGFAFKGIWIFLRTPSNAWVHLVAALLACVAGFYLGISKTEWIAVIFAIGFVIVAEMLNTAIEMLTNLVSPDYNELAGRLKDVSAGAVLAASITAAIVGGIVFFPKIC